MHQPQHRRNTDMHYALCYFISRRTLQEQQQPIRSMNKLRSLIYRETNLGPDASRRVCGGEENNRSFAKAERNFINKLATKLRYAQDTFDGRTHTTSSMDHILRKPYTLFGSNLFFLRDHHSISCCA